MHSESVMEHSLISSILNSVPLVCFIFFSLNAYCYYEIVNRSGNSIDDYESRCSFYYDSVFTYRNTFFHPLNTVVVKSTVINVFGVFYFTYSVTVKIFTIEVGDSYRSTFGLNLAVVIVFVFHYVCFCDCFDNNSSERVLRVL